MFNHACAVPPTETEGYIPRARIPLPPAEGYVSRRVTPNSGKKRRVTPNLSRATPTSSHGVKMAMIFRDAATTLQDVKTPTRRTSSNTTRLRLPATQTRSTPFGSVRRDCKGDPSGPKSPCTNSFCSSPYSGKVPKTPEALCRSAVAFHRSSKDTRLGTHSTDTDGKSGQAFTPPKICHDPASPTPLSFKEDYFGPQDVDANGKEPISSSFSTPWGHHPSHPYGSSPHSVNYSTLKLHDEHYTFLRPLSPTLDNLDCHSSHGVPLVIPIASLEQDHAHGFEIDSWLNEVLEASPDEAPEQRKSPPPLPPRPATRSLNEPNSPFKYPNLRSVSRTSSNKENLQPQHPSPSRIPSPSCSPLNVPSPSQPPRITTPAPTRRLLHPLTPSNLLTQPPKRRKQVTNTPPLHPRIQGEEFDIYDEVCEEMKVLTPGVKRYRRGKGPKRERCSSYWDEDILLRADVGEEAEEREGEKVLCESVASRELIREKGFVEGVGRVMFEFRAWDWGWCDGRGNGERLGERIRRERGGGRGGILSRRVLENRVETVELI